VARRAGAGGAAVDPMVGLRNVDDVRARARHVTRDAVLATPPGLPLGQWHGATLFLVAFETALAVVGSLDGWFGQPVRVVAGDAAELALARAEAAARFQLLDLTSHLDLARVAVLLDENCQETVQGQARAEVKEVTARPGEAEPALQMTLLADRIPQRGG